MVDGHDGAQEVEQLITEDWSYIAEVVDSRYELEDIQQTLQVQRSSQENVSSRYVKENKFNQVLQLTAQMKNILICQQQLEQQQLKLVELSDEGCYRGQDRGHLENCYMPQDSVGAEDCDIFVENLLIQLLKRLEKKWIRLTYLNSITNNHFTGSYPVHGTN